MHKKRKLKVDLNMIALLRVDDAWCFMQLSFCSVTAPLEANNNQSQPEVPLRRLALPDRFFLFSPPAPNEFHAISLPRSRVEEKIIKNCFIKLVRRCTVKRGRVKLALRHKVLI